MRHIIFILFLVLPPALTFGQAEQSRFSYATTIGTGIDMGTPSHTPFSWQVLGYYNINQRFAIGAGTELSVYEKVLLPLYGDFKFKITRPHKFTPYIECGAGYSFAVQQNTNGGLYLNPSVGTEFSICPRLKLLLAVGYGLQKLECLKHHQDNYFISEFQERLNHNSITFKVGIML